MSIKKLFGKSFRSYESASVDVESPTFITNTVRERETYLPPIDFATASNFVKYGSAKLYYEKSISRIYDDFPYDGSKAEKINFHQSSSYLDRWMFEVKYPKTTGYVTLGKTTSYTAPDAALITAGYYPTSVDEYVRVWGGLHTASAGMIGDQLQKNFDSSIKFDNALNRMQNWRLDLVSGSTVEFWLQKPSFGTTLGTGLPLTAREVILDLWNGEATGSDNYGRLTIEITASGTPDPDGACFQATLQSGTYGFMTSSICSTTVTTSSLSSWHHYAISFVSAAGGIKSRFYVDGEENLTQTINCGERVSLPAAAVGEIPGLITGYLGALQQRPSGNVFSAFDMQGYGKFSGSLDEFRFWKNRRTSRQIELNWFRQIGGGANTDKNTTDLGVYFTFNEGIVGSTGIDQNVLDFSGRLANGYWEGYTDGARSTNSAFNLSAQNLTESQTPIMYSFHPSVTALETEMTNSGSLYDNEYGSSLYASLPNWLQEEDGLGNKNLKYVSQILSSYFDTLYAQISALSNLKNKGYLESQYKAPPFARQLLESKGFITKDLFVDSKIVELFSSADFDAIKFENNITEIKNLIYLNIYNNLEKIYKSKGTEKSIRNFIRCFGIDDEIIKLNMYTDGGIHYFTDKAKGTSVKKKYLNFNSSSFWGATIFQTTGSTDNALTFISGSDASTISASWSAFTFEADIVVPYKAAATEIGYFNTPFLSSSIFGFHEANESDVASYTWNKPEVADLQVYLTRDELNSKNARFTLKNQDGTINWASSYIEDIYDNNHWNLAIRIKPNTYPYAGNVATSSAPAYTLDFYAVNYNFDEIANQVTASFALNSASGSAFITRPKRVYAGAHLLNFTGAVDTYSDIQLGATRVWYDYLSGSAIQQHNLDPTNFGARKAYEGSNIFLFPNKQIPSDELTVFNWDFDTVTGSDASGEFTIADITSGSSTTIYGWIDNIIRREYKGIGRGFGTSNTAFLENEFLYAQKKELPEISFTNDNVFIKTESDINFITDDDVSDSFYLLEKSMNQIVSEEMLKMFSTVHEFSNLIGRPIDGYRQSYKRLAKVREHFFKRVEQDTNLETFLNYYKWIDSSISKMIQQLIPASVNFGPGITDVIESHILERNKYQRRVGLLDTVESTEGIMLGINELTYNWKFGHAPVPRIGVKAQRTMLDATIGDISNGHNFTINVPTPIGSGETITVTFLTTLTSPAADEIQVKIQGSTATMCFVLSLVINGLASAGNISYGADAVAALGTLDTLTLASTYVIVIAPSAGPSGNGITFTDVVGTVVANGAGTSPATLQGGVWLPQPVNCLWNRERQPPAGSLYAEREAIRKVFVNQTNATSSTLSTITKTTYQGSTYVPRALGVPYKLSIDFSDSIHGGINYNKQKNRDWVRTATWIHGKIRSSAPVNILTVGLGTGYGIVEKQRCDDVYNPNKKDILNLEVVTGKYAAANATAAISPVEEYMYKLPSHLFWPFNMVSGNLPSGFNKTVSSSFKSTTILANLHSDTIDITNEIPMQGPFTQAHVGGNQNRHIDLNKYASGSHGIGPGGLVTPNGLQYVYTRPEAWALLLGPNPLRPSDPDGAMGFTGPDYGSPYPDTRKKLAIWYREERAKRPVNVKNIQTTTASAVLGNYQQPYEVLSTFSNQKRYLRQYSGSSLLPACFGGSRGNAFAILQIAGIPGNGAFTLTDTDGNSQAFIVDRTSTVANGTKDGSSRVIIGISPLSTFATSPHYSRRFFRALEGAYLNGDVNIVPSASNLYDAAYGYRVHLKQRVPGIGGNTAIDMSSVADVDTQTGMPDNFVSGALLTGLPQTTNYMTLVGQAPYPYGNVFGVANNNRQPGTGSMEQTVQATGQWTITTATQTPQSTDNGTITLQRQGSPTLDGFVFKFQNASHGYANGAVIAGTTIAILLVTDNWLSTVTNWVDAFNGRYAYDGNEGAESLTASFTPTPEADGYTINIREVGQIGAAGNGGGITKGAGLGGITAPGSPGFAGGGNLSADGNDIVIELPRTDLTSSKQTITTRFSAPGGPEINSRGYLDITTEQYSVYNSLNFRNLSVRSSGSGEKAVSSTVGTTASVGGDTPTIRVNSNIGKREGLRTLLARHCGKFGADGQYGSVTADTYVTVPAFYKQHRNTLVTPRITSSRLRKAIVSPATFLNKDCSLGNYATNPFSISNGFSISCWLRKDNTLLDSGLLEVFRENSTSANALSLIVNSDNTISVVIGFTSPTTKSILIDTSSTITLGKWHFITFTWNGNSDTSPKLYVDKVLQTVSSTSFTTSGLVPWTWTGLNLFDNVTGVHTYELAGALADFALWRMELSQDQITSLYELDGIATAASYVGSLQDYWSLGTENTLSALTGSDAIVNGTLIPSAIGGDTLTTVNNLSCSAGPYAINIATDTNVYNNMSVTSLLPRSTFQYSWINAAISGSANWMNNQRVRGYAPKSGEMRIIGAGSPLQVVSAINFPTASSLFGGS